MSNRVINNDDTIGRMIVDVSVRYGESFFVVVIAFSVALVWSVLVIVGFRFVPTAFAEVAQVAFEWTDNGGTYTNI